MENISRFNIAFDCKSLFRYSNIKSKYVTRSGQTHVYMKMSVFLYKGDHYDTE